MRSMRPNPDRGFPSQYICSDCNWSFPLEHVSEVADFLEQKAAIRAFSAHDCALFRAPIEEGGNFLQSA